MSHPILILTRNNLDLTKKCLDSVLKQDVPIQPWIVDNGSSDGTQEWAKNNGFRYIFFDRNYGVTYPWNVGLNLIFKEHDHCLVIGNDTHIPPWYYRTLASYDVPFITGVAVNDMNQLVEPKGQLPMTNNPDFSAFFLTRDFWNEVGPFDERTKYYCQDCLMHVKAHKMGIPMWKISCEYYHIPSATIRLSSEEERRQILEGANRDRQVFRDIYGCIPGEEAYNDLFK
jgi:GT2 family glycosyltransferase